MNKEQALKRDENLVILSHEHHHGLMFCVRLKKASDTDSETLRSFVQDYWNNHLSDHFVREEKLLIPFTFNASLKNQLLNEHADIKLLVNKITQHKNDEITENAIILSKKVNDHIRFEERILFPWLQRNLNPNELRYIGEELDKIEISGHNYSPEFWKL